MPDFTMVPLPWEEGREAMLDLRRTITPEGLGAELATWPVTVVLARYQGSYEPGRWLAFPVAPRDLDDGPLAEWDGSDVECAEFWRDVDEQRWPIGRGRTADAAHQDLLARLAEASDVKLELDGP